MDILKLSGLGLILFNLAQKNGQSLSTFVAPAIKAVAPKMLDGILPNDSTDGIPIKKVALSAFALWLIWKNANADKILRSGAKVEAISVSTLADRIRIIRDMITKAKADAKVRELAAGILHQARVTQKDWDGEVQAVFEWVKANIRYTRDTEGLDTFTEPLKTVSLGVGDCDDMSILLASLLGSIGYPFKLKVVSMSGIDWDHIFPLVGMPPSAPKMWIPLDASIELPLGSEVVSKKSELFEV